MTWAPRGARLRIPDGRQVEWTPAVRRTENVAAGLHVTNVELGWRGRFEIKVEVLLGLHSGHTPASPLCPCPQRTGGATWPLWALPAPPSLRIEAPASPLLTHTPGLKPSPCPVPTAILPPVSSSSCQARPGVPALLPCPDWLRVTLCHHKLSQSSTARTPETKSADITPR